MKTLLLCALMLPAVALAQVHKCTGVDGRITYSESPCSGAVKSSQVDIQLRTPGSAQGSSEPARNAYMAELNNKISSALERGDFTTARRLAVTEEHFRVIKEVEQIEREERAAAKAERRARRPTVCTTMGQSNGRISGGMNANTRSGLFGDTTTGTYGGTYSGVNNSTTICNK